MFDSPLFESLSALPRKKEAAGPPVKSLAAPDQGHREDSAILANDCLNTSFFC
jgi:hypothetical protein